MAVSQQKALQQEKFGEFFSRKVLIYFLIQKYSGDID